MGIAKLRIPSLAKYVKTHTCTYAVAPSAIAPPDRALQLRLLPSTDRGPACTAQRAALLTDAAEISPPPEAHVDVKTPSVSTRLKD